MWKYALLVLALLAWFPNPAVGFGYGSIAGVPGIQRSIRTPCTSHSPKVAWKYDGVPCKPLLPALRSGNNVAPASEDSAGKLWGGLSTKAVHTATVSWVKNMVIGLNLCPFALDAMPGLKVVVGDVEMRDDALALVEDELQQLAAISKDKPATTLIVLPPALFEQLRAESGEPKPADEELTGLENFEEFLELAEEANALAQELAEEGLPQGDALLLTFHPDSTYSDVPYDPADFALRSPYPVLHLLRGCDVTSAEKVCEKQGRTTEDIALENEARLRGEGYRELSHMLAEIISKNKK